MFSDSMKNGLGYLILTAALFLISSVFVKTESDLNLLLFIDLFVEFTDFICFSITTREI